jgi:hypothetical protein
MRRFAVNVRSLRCSSGLDTLKLACFLVLIACGSTEPIEKNLLFEGTITNAATGAPIAGAGVSVGNGRFPVPEIFQSTASDLQGHYTLPHSGCIFDPYIYVGASGYLAGQEKVGCKPDSQTLNFSLTPNAQAP